MSGDVEYILMQQNMPDSKAPGFDCRRCCSKLGVVKSIGTETEPRRADVTASPAEATRARRDTCGNIAAAERHEPEDRVVEHRPQDRRPVILADGKLRSVSAQAHARAKRAGADARG